MAKKWIIYGFLLLFISAGALYIQGDKKPIKENLAKALNSKEPRLFMKDVELVLYQGTEVVESFEASELRMFTDHELECDKGLRRSLYDEKKPGLRKSQLRADRGNIIFEDSLLSDGDKDIKMGKLELRGSVFYKDPQLQLKSSEAVYDAIKDEVKGFGYIEALLQSSKKIRGSQGFLFKAAEGSLEMFGAVSGEFLCN